MAFIFSLQTLIVVNVIENSFCNESLHFLMLLYAFNFEINNQNWMLVFVV